MEQKRTLELYVVLSYDTKQLSKLFEFRSKCDCSVWVIVEYEMVNLKARKIGRIESNGMVLCASN